MSNHAGKTTRNASVSKATNLNMIATISWDVYLPLLPQICQQQVQQQQFQPQWTRQQWKMNGRHQPVNMYGRNQQVPLQQVPQQQPRQKTTNTTTTTPLLHRLLRLQQQHRPCRLLLRLEDTKQRQLLLH